VSLRSIVAKSGQWPASIARGFQYAFYDFTREMSRIRRIITWVAILVQGYAIYALETRSFAWPIMWPSPRVVFIVGIVVFYSAYTLMNGLLASELTRKSQLEADQTAARKIQQMLIPQELEPLSDYAIETYYQPFREVGGDYFDVIALPERHTLIALADVSGKGMAAALLSANIQALVRSISSAGAEPLALATQINQHLCRHSPTDFFATAIFLLLNRDSGELTYVNAGHNAPVIFGNGVTRMLQATGLPLGLFDNAEYEMKTASLDLGDSLLLLTDGLTDSIRGDDPEARVRTILQGGMEIKKTMLNLRSLVDPRLNCDDVTIVLVTRFSLPCRRGNQDHSSQAIAQPGAVREPQSF
jgi:serine phosphatase RsbU (regulator of sigma subunit)